MNIKFHKSLEKVLSTTKACQREFGNKAKYIVKRLNAIHSVDGFNGLWDIPGNFHELTYGVKGVYSLTVKDGLRMVMRIDNSSNSVYILAIEDYHGGEKRVIKYNYL